MITSDAPRQSSRCRMNTICPAAGTSRGCRPGDSLQARRSPMPSDRARPHPAPGGSPGRAGHSHGPTDSVV
eukprot:746779-Hanusia_phi.AAC.3